MAMNYVLLGAAGFVAPRHMKAIKETGGNLIAAMDKNDSVGIIDSYFPDAEFFTEFENLDRFLYRKDTPKIDYVVVCTPNYLHDAHIRYGLRIADVICEKPLVIRYHNIESIKHIEQETGNRVYNILQLRYNQSMADFVTTYDHVISLKYHTPRGKWYQYSWKGDESKSGGLLYNIGVHFFDLLINKFGEPQEFRITEKTPTFAKGMLQLENGYCRWELSIESSRPERTLTVDGKDIDLNAGFTDAHTKSYQEILAGRGFRIDEASKAIKLLSEWSQ
jgi:UDP-N-acetyl-2-amino-2-deoxyglucuronate dehydrogenase